MNGDRHDDGPQRLVGIDPQAAADELRAILAASGEGEGIVAQLGALSRWAEKAGRRVGPGFDLSRARLGGLEHYVWKDGPESVVRKFTYGGAFGRTVRSIRQGLVPATPLEYLVRWANHNALFPPITRISGVFEANRDGLAFLIEQEALLGDLPSLSEVEEFLRGAGYAPLAAHPFAWENRETGYALFDARPANFVRVSDVPIPFDLIVVPLEDLDE
jgi:hypothetical protein